MITEDDALTWCQRCNVTIESASFDDEKLWLVHTIHDGKRIEAIFRDFTGAVTRLRCKLKSQKKAA